MIERQSGLMRFFTWTFWRLQLAFWWYGVRGLNVIEVFEIEVKERDDTTNL